VLTSDVENFLDYRAVGFDTIPPVCTPEAVADRTCDPGELADGAFFPRATGGSYLLEGNVEYRFAFGGEFQGVAFLDFGQVWREGGGVSLGDVELTPGIGVRYFSPVGPIRVDLGYRFRGAERLQVVTSQIRPYVAGADGADDRICIATLGVVPAPSDSACPTGRVPIPWVQENALAILRDPVLYGSDALTWRNLQIHFSIGQAF
jgi:hypothetical protein